LHDGAERGFWQAFSTSFLLVFARLAKPPFFCSSAAAERMRSRAERSLKPREISLVFFMK
jgi:hypothetical protein